MTTAGLQASTGGQPVTATPQSSAPASTPSTAAVSAPAQAPAGSSSDPWADAEVTFNAEGGEGGDPFAELPNAVLEPAEGAEQGKTGPDGKAEQPAEKAADQESKAEGADGNAPPESDSENFWSTEGLDSPEKVASRLKKIQGFMTKKSQESKAETEKIKEANGVMAGLISQVANDPTKLGPILQQHGKDLEAAGIPVNWDAINAAIDGAKAPKGGDADPTGKPSEELQVQKSAYLEGAAKHLLGSKDDADFGQRVGDLIWNAHQQAINEVRQAVDSMKTFVQQTAKSEVEPFVREKQVTEKINMWSSAITDLSADPAMDGFAQATKAGDNGLSDLDRHIETDPMLKMWVVAINKNPGAAAKAGITPKLLLARAYNDLNTPNRIKAAEEKAKKALQNKIEQSGEIPGAHTQTVRTGGDDWDNIEKEVGDPFRELYA